ncbi:hypothetical protein [Candidatus Mesenet endosymbiont of Agriotes lineatus]|uniref:hypothetical protein n=1 Tax=Candidatus Mesenet endosymbiont of Agriotes lineatus TaxID=3077948 RepID=UPI0030CF66D7
MFSNRKDFLGAEKVVKKGKADNLFQKLKCITKNYTGHTTADLGKRKPTRCPYRVIRNYLREATARDIYANDFLLFLRQPKEFDRYKYNQHLGIYNQAILSLDIGNQYVNDLLPKMNKIILNNLGKKSIKFNMINENHRVIALQYYLGDRKSHFNVLNTSLNSFFAKAAYSSDLNEIIKAVRIIIKYNKNSIVSNNLQSQEVIFNKKGQQIDNLQAEYEDGFCSIGIVLNPKHTYSTTYQVIKLIAHQFIHYGDNKVNKIGAAKLFVQMIKCNIGPQEVIYALNKFFTDYKLCNDRAFVCYLEDCMIYIVNKANDNDIINSLEKMSVVSSELQQTESFSSISSCYTTSPSTSI